MSSYIVVFQFSIVKHVDLPKVNKVILIYVHISYLCIYDWYDPDDRLAVGMKI